MVKRLIGQLKLMISRVLNLLNDSDLGTYVMFLDAILERYNKSHPLQSGGGRMPFDVYRDSWFPKLSCIKDFSIFVF